LNLLTVFFDLPLERSKSWQIKKYENALEALTSINSVGTINKAKRLFERVYCKLYQK
jgi:hypothetical protein